MNKEYTYLDGKVIVVDENDEQKLIEYSANLNSILEKGILDKKLEKNYTKKEINSAKEYLEENGPSLSRKK